MGPGDPSTGAAPARSDEARSDEDRPPRGALLAALALFLVSGAVGLAYEVAWTRRLLLLLGSTSVASALVLSVFLGGLGLGARVLGPLADRVRRPIALYGVLELVGAAWAVAVPPLVAALEGPFAAFASEASDPVRMGLRLLVATLVVAPGAFVLGGTFPALLRTFIRSEREVGPRAVALYATNTIGAVAGALFTGFFGWYVFGVAGVIRVAAAAAALVGIGALALAFRLRPRERRPASPPPPPAIPRTCLYLAAFSGFLGLGLEAAGVRILVFFVEGFTASFAAMLGAFLTGLALGSLLLGPFLVRRADPRRALGALLFATGAALLLELVLLPHFEPWLRGARGGLYAGRGIAEAQRWTALIGSFAAFLLPGVLLGATFPVAVAWGAGPRPEAVGAAAGRVHLWNALGSVVGPLAVLALGLLGAHVPGVGGPLLAWGLLGGLAVAVGGATLLATLPRGPARLALGLALAAALVGGGIALRSHVTSEALVRASHVMRGPDGGASTTRRLLAVRADETTTASVIDVLGGERILYTDDFAAAATGRAYPYMRMLGHLPLLSSARAENVLVIAFGTGTTAGAVAATPEVKHLEVVEASRAVIDLAPWFSGVNQKVLDDPRVRLRIADGRQALLLHAADLDVITLEPLMPYTPAALPFYTREFYELARDRVRDGGVVCQWVPVHAMPLDVYAALVRTFFETFPEGSLWFFEQSTVLVGHKGTLRPDDATVTARADALAAVLRDAGWARPAAVAGAFVATSARVRAVLLDPTKSSQPALRESPPGALSRRRVTDDDPFPEAWPAPRAAVATTWLADTLGWLAGLVDPLDDPSTVPVFRLVPRERWAGLREATSLGLVARSTEAVAEFRLAAARGPGAAAMRAEGLAGLERAAEQYRSASDAFAHEDLGLERRRLRTLLVHLGASVRDRLARADGARARADPSDERAALEDALALARRAATEESDAAAVDAPAAGVRYAQVLVRAGRCAEAEAHVADLLARRPQDPDLARAALSVAAVRSGAPFPADADAAWDEWRRIRDTALPCGR